MEADLGKILGKVTDYKICGICKAVNWYENETCSCGKNDFLEKPEDVKLWVSNELQFWTEIEGYTEDEASNIFYDI